MLRLKKLVFKNIGRFVDLQVIHFDDLGNLIQLDGNNLNTGGSSGSGKSTVFHALDFLLGINEIPATILQSRLTEEGIVVYADFDWDHRPVTIIRSKSRGFIVRVHETEYTGKRAEEELDTILAMPRTLFSKLLHKRQGEGGFFLSLGPKDTHKFLGSCLNLSAMQAKLVIVENKLSELEKSSALNKGELDKSRAALKATQDAILTLGLAPIRDMHPEVVETLRAKMLASDKAVKDLMFAQGKARMALDATRPPNYMQPYDTSAIKNYEEFIVQIKIELDRLVAAERERQAQVTREIYALSTERTAMERAIAEGNRSKRESEELAAQVKKIRESICHTCERHWNDDKSKAEEAKLISKLMAHKTIIDAGVAATEHFLQLGNKIEELKKEAVPRVPEGAKSLKAQEQELAAKIAAEREKEKAHNQAELQKAHAINDAHAAKLSELMNVQSKESEQVRGQLDVDRRAYEAAQNKLSLYEVSSSRYNTSMAQLKAQEGIHSRSVDELSAKVNEIEQELLLAEELKKAIKSYVSRFFEDALAYVSEASTRIIRRIPNMANATIQLEGTKETQEGKVKEEVNAVINVDGEVNVPIKSLSGGERSAVDLAIDLAVIDLIELKTGKGIDIFILDEPFNGLGSVEIEMALEVLRNSNSTKRLVIVDHNPEIKQMVQDRIVVTRKGTVSSIGEAA
jgi:DNA repair exonuclease SbcCD ATPase subunit